MVVAMMGSGKTINGLAEECNGIRYDVEWIDGHTNDRSLIINISAIPYIIIFWVSIVCMLTYLVRKSYYQREIVRPPPATALQETAGAPPASDSTEQIVSCCSVS